MGVSSAWFDIALPRLDFRVRVAYLAKIGSAWTRVEVGKQRVVVLLCLHLHHATARIINVAKDNRLSWTYLLASGHNFAVKDRPPVALGFDLAGLNALHTICAFFHYAPAADGHIGVMHQLEASRVVVGILIKVEM